MGVVVTLEVDGDIVQLPDPSGGSFSAAGDFDRLLQLVSTFPMLSRIDEFGEVQFSSAELVSVRDEVSSLLRLARDGPERRGVMRFLALASYGSQLPRSALRVVGD